MVNELLDLNGVRIEDEIIQLHAKYGNKGLVELLSLLKLSRSFTRALGCEVFDQDGVAYMDMLGSYGANNLGHNPPVVCEALIDLIRSCPPNFLQTALGEYSAVLAHNLAAVAPGKLLRTFFCNSGAEAVECAFKMARAATGRQRMISLEGSFHGKSMGALSLTGKKLYQEPFMPMVPGCRAIPFGDLEVLNYELQSRDVAGFIVEPVLGEGGVRIHPDGYLKEAERLCHKYGTLFIVDEVQTGLGRTGKLFASEHDDLKPDIMCLAKSLGGSMMPIGATMATDDVWQKSFGGMKCLSHTSTCGNGAYACGVGIVALAETIRLNLANKAAEDGEYLMARLRELQKKHKIIKDVRGKGLLIGIELNAGGVVGKLAYDYIGSLVVGPLFTDHHIIVAYTLNNPTVVRVEPPLIITREQIDKFVTALDIVLSESGSVSKLALKAVVGLIKGKISGNN